MDGQEVIDKLAKPEAEKQPEAPHDAAAKPVSQRPVFTDVRRPESKPTADTKPVTPKNDPPASPEDPPASPKEVAELTDDPAEKLEEPKKKHGKPEVAKPPKPPRQPGVGLAIVATVVIVLGLAALATYAYLQTNGKAPF